MFSNFKCNLHRFWKPKMLSVFCSIGVLKTIGLSLTVSIAFSTSFCETSSPIVEEGRKTRVTGSSQKRGKIAWRLLYASSAPDQEFFSKYSTWYYLIASEMRVHCPLTVIFWATFQNRVAWHLRSWHVCCTCRSIPFQTNRTLVVSVSWKCGVSQ